LLEYGHRGRPICRPAPSHLRTITFISMNVGSEDVQTPKEVYEALAAQGYRVQYHRVPITDGSSPREAIFDQFYQAIWLTKQLDPIVFNCQMGAGRTTMGMVIACLVRAKQFGEPSPELTILPNLGFLLCPVCTPISPYATITQTYLIIDNEIHSA